MLCCALACATTCMGSSPTGALMEYDAERRLELWQNVPSNLTSQMWFLYDGSGQWGEQYTSGGSTSHTSYLHG